MPLLRQDPLIRETRAELVFAATRLWGVNLDMPLERRFGSSGRVSEILADFGVARHVAQEGLKRMGDVLLRGHQGMAVGSLETIIEGATQVVAQHGWEPPLVGQLALADDHTPEIIVEPAQGIVEHFRLLELARREYS